MIFRKINKLVLLAGVALLATSCHNPVFDYEGDCEVGYYMRFVYDMNLKWADAFPSEVHSVNLYAFDQNGLFVKEFKAVAPEVDQPDYLMKLNLGPGQYRFVAWCGLDNGNGASESFTVPSPVAGKTKIEELTASLKTHTVASYSNCSDSRLYFLYHGMIQETLPDSKNGADYIYTMPLTKDTNHIRIVLQQLSGDDMESTDFNFIITDANGKMAYDNALIGNDVVTYLPWDQKSDEVGVGKEQVDGSYNLVKVNGVVADLSVSRLMANHKDDLFLTVYNTKTGTEIIAQVPLIQYALLSKSYYEMSYGHNMSEQEFLDREDEYVLTFFLDKNLAWLSSSILIHSWRVLLDEYEM